MTWSRPVPQTIPRLLAEGAERFGDRHALTIAGESVTYAGLVDRVEVMARGLRELGVGPGDVVGVYMGNSMEILDVWFACARLGAVYSPFNTSYRGEFLLHQLATSGASVFVADADLALAAASATAAVEGLEHLVVRPGNDAEVDAEAFPGLKIHTTDEVRTMGGDRLHLPRQPRYDDPGAIIYTAGTTGRSKGATLSQHYVVRLGQELAGITEGRPDDVCYTPLPLFHLNAMVTTVVAPLSRGAAGVIDARFSASGFLDRVRDVGATHGSILGAMIMMLWNQPRRGDDAATPLHTLLAIPVPPAIHHAFCDRYGVRVVMMFGMSEASPVISTRPSEPAPPGSAGKPFPLFDVLLVDEDDGEVPVGEPGEIIVRPREPHVMFDGYWRDPAATVAAWRNLWFHTGDLARRDEDGWYFFVDRKKDSLRRRGENISSMEVELAILELDAVAEVAVVGVASDLTEDEVKACVVLQPGAMLSPEALLEHCVANMPYFAVPRYVEFVDELPKNPVGRVLKFELRRDPLNERTWDREAAGYEVRRPT